MKALLIHDGSALSELCEIELADEELEITSVADSLASDTFAQACAPVSAVIVVRTSWDASVGEEELQALDDLIAVLMGTGKKLLYLSAATVIGDTDKLIDGFGNEDSPATIHSPHPWQVEAERRLLRAIDDNVHSIIVRPALLHGRGAGDTITQLARHAAYSGESVYVGDGSARVSTVHVEDLLVLIRTALQRGPQGATYAAASPEVLSWREVAELVAGEVVESVATSITAEQARSAGLDAGTLSISNVIRDHRAARRFGWAAKGATLREEPSNGLAGRTSHR